MSSIPRVAVILPCFNQASWVQDAIESVAKQDDYVSKDIYLVDDASTDGSLDKVRNMLVEYRDSGWGVVLDTNCRINIQSLAINSGPSAARNAGLSMAAIDPLSSAYMFLDCDDYYLPTKIGKSVGQWLASPETIGMVYSDYEIERPDGHRQRSWSEPYSRQRLVQENIINPLSLVSRLAIEQCGTFDETLRTCEDYDLWLRISERFNIAHIPEVLAIKRVGPHDSTSTVSSERWRHDYATVKTKMMDRAKGTQ